MTENRAEQFNSKVSIVSVDSSVNGTFRDIYYEIVNDIQSCEQQAICLVGLKGTGKKTVLNQLYVNSDAFGMTRNQVLYVRVHAEYCGKLIERDQLAGFIGQSTECKIEYPRLNDILNVLEQEQKVRTIKCILIDEITLCSDFITCGRKFVDKLLSCDTKLVFTGTDSASFYLAEEQSLYKRLNLKEMGYIPFGEYCRLKGCKLDTLESKSEALEKYVKSGNTLSDTPIDSGYIHDALGLNLALSIINSNEKEFMEYNNKEKKLAKALTDYYELIESEQSLNVSDMEYFPAVQLTFEQLWFVEKIMSELGLGYVINDIAERKDSTGAVDANTVFMIRPGLDATTVEATRDINSNRQLHGKIKPTEYSRMLKSVLAFQLLKSTEKKRGIAESLKVYGTSGYKTSRKCSKPYMYTYEDAGIGLIIHSENVLELIQIKASTVVAPYHTRCLNDRHVIQNIKELLHLSADIPVRKYVYYLGENTTADGVEYKNIVDILLANYNADIAPVDCKSDVEIAKELKRNAYLKQLGIDVYETDSLNAEKQLDLQSDKNWALSYVLAGKPVPKDMEERLIRAEQERLRRDLGEKVKSLYSKH